MPANTYHFQPSDTMYSHRISIFSFFFVVPDYVHLISFPMACQRFSSVIVSMFQLERIQYHCQMSASYIYPIKSKENILVAPILTHRHTCPPAGIPPSQLPAPTPASPPAISRCCINKCVYTLTRMHGLYQPRILDIASPPLTLALFSSLTAGIILVEA